MERESGDTVEFRPISDWVLIRKCVHPDIMKDDGSVLLYLDDYTKNDTNWVEVIDVGPKCKNLRKEHVGLLVHCKEEQHRDLMRMPKSIDDDELFVAREHLVDTYIYTEA